MSTPPTISAVIPTYNRATMVCDCVRSVLATGYPALEVIVVDDFSPDDTGARLRAEFGGDPRVRYQRNERNTFQAVSRNNGARNATGDYLLFLDDDNLVHKGIFTELLAVFSAHPNAGLVAPLAIHQRPGKTNAVWSLGSDFNRWTSQPKDSHPNLPYGEFEKMTSTSADKVFPTTYYPNGFMVPRTVFDAVRGFEESYEQIFEESDFGWKIMESGRDCLIAAEARTDHLGFLEPGCVPALRQLGIEKPRRTYCFARNRLRFARRHFNPAQILSVTIIFAPLSALYYCGVALKNRRPDIAWAYLKGTFAGIFGL